MSRCDGALILTIGIVFFAILQAEKQRRLSRSDQHDNGLPPVV